MIFDLNIGYPVNDANRDGSPLPTQERFHLSNAKYRLLAGGFATGKTTTLCLEILKELFKHENNYGVLGRKDLQELKSTTLKELLEILPSELISNHNKQDRIIRLVNGSELYYMNLDDAREATDKIKSLNLGFVAIDQLEELQENIFLAFQGRLRRQESSRNFFATCNPAGHDWLWGRWKNQPPNEEYQLFEAITLENKYLPADYVKELLDYPERWVKRYVYCSWEEFEGLVFNEFIESKHKIEPYEPADSEKYTFVLDYGFRNPTAILYAATDYDGITRIYDEYYESGKLVSYISEQILKKKAAQKAYMLADPSIHKVERDGNNVFNEFLENGIFLSRADNNVLQGINRVNQLLKDGRLLICANCVNTLREIGGYKWKAIKPGEVKNEYEEPIKRDDHTMDDLRYLANYIIVPKEQVEQEIVTRPHVLKQLNKSDIVSY